MGPWLTPSFISLSLFKSKLITEVLPGHHNEKHLHSGSKPPSAHWYVLPHSSQFLCIPFSGLYPEHSLRLGNLIKSLSWFKEPQWLSTAVGFQDITRSSPWVTSASLSHHIPFCALCSARQCCSYSISTKRCPVSSGAPTLAFPPPGIPCPLHPTHAITSGVCLNTTSPGRISLIPQFF